MRDTNMAFRAAAAGNVTADETSLTGLPVGPLPKMGVPVEALIPQNTGHAGADTILIKFQHSDVLGSGYEDLYTLLAAKDVGLTGGIARGQLPWTPRKYIRAYIDITDVGGGGVNFGAVEIYGCTGGEQAMIYQDF